MQNIDHQSFARTLRSTEYSISMFLHGYLKILQFHWLSWGLERTRVGNHHIPDNSKRSTPHQCTVNHTSLNKIVQIFLIFLGKCLAEVSRREPADTNPNFCPTSSHHELEILKAENQQRKLQKPHT